MRDRNKLRFSAHAAHVRRIPGDVFLVKRRFNLVHDAKRRRSNAHDGKIQRNGNECLFSAGEKADVGDGLSGRLDADVDAAVENIVHILKRERRLAAAEKLHKYLAERFVDLPDLTDKDLFHLRCDVGDDL